MENVESSTYCESGPAGNRPPPLQSLNKSFNEPYNCECVTAALVPRIACVCAAKWVVASMPTKPGRLVVGEMMKPGR